MIKAIIEMPKGDTRRRHLNYEKTAIVDLGSIADKIPVNNGIMPVAYGYIPNTLNPKENDEIDILVLSNLDFKVGDMVETEAVSIIKRDDGDDKIVAIDKTIMGIHAWEDIDLQLRNLITDFFSYQHKIELIEDAKAAETFIEENRL